MALMSTRRAAGGVAMMLAALMTIERATAQCCYGSGSFTASGVALWEDYNGNWHNSNVTESVDADNDMWARVVGNGANTANSIQGEVVARSADGTGVGAEWSEGHCQGYRYTGLPKLAMCVGANTLYPQSGGIINYGSAPQRGQLWRVADNNNEMDHVVVEDATCTPLFVFTRGGSLAYSNPHQGALPVTFFTDIPSFCPRMEELRANFTNLKVRSGYRAGGIRGAMSKTAVVRH